MTIGAASGANMPGEAVGSFRSSVLTALSHRGFQVTSDKPAGVFVQLSGTVTMYNPGNRFSRWFGGAGGKLDSTWTVSDSKGIELSRAQIDSSVTGGAWGGSMEDVFTEAGQRVADYLSGVRN